METNEEAVKMIYKNDERVGCFVQNGTLKIYKLIEVSYKDIEELFDQKDTQKS